MLHCFFATIQYEYYFDTNAQFLLIPIIHTKAHTERNFVWLNSIWFKFYTLLNVLLNMKN